ncbi:MAG TPA: substrate-binding domain-containing protein [Baekduia sp.]|nr:substrate-binding domain-containing protein [Baekduia sp.]
MGHSTRVFATCCALAATIGVAACGSSSNSTNTGSSAVAAAGGGEMGKGLRFIFVGNQSKATPTASLLVNGAKAADGAFGTKTEYRAVQGQTFDANEERRILESALAQKPDGVIVANAAPPQLNATIKKIADAGIPVVLVNAGLGETANTGALTYIGNDEEGTGVLGGQLLGKTGAKHALLITLQPGIPVGDLRTKGFKQGFPGKVTTVELSVKDLFDSTKVRNITQAELEKDKSIDSAFTIGDCCSAPMLAAAKAVGSRAENMHFGTIDLGKPTLEGIKGGTMDFGLDQQAWMQGYLGVQTLLLNVRYGMQPGSDLTATGPVPVDKANVDRVVELTGKGIR